MLSCFVFRKQVNQNINYKLTVSGLQYHYYHQRMKGIKKPHRREMSPQINSQDPLSDLPHLHVADESNMVAEMAELEICRYPGNARSKVWEYFGSYQLQEGPKTKEHLDMTKVICRLCRSNMPTKVCGTCVLLISCQSHLNCCNVILNIKTV